MMVRWRTRFLSLFLLFALSQSIQVTAQNKVPRVWLVQPQSRTLEHDPTVTRLTETKCPTTKKDTGQLDFQNS